MRNGTPYTAVPDADLEKILDRALEAIADEIEALHLPYLRAVVLGGGYGRGEGGVFHTPSGSALYNDLDFFVFSEGADSGASRKIDESLKEISIRWERNLGIAADFGPVKNVDTLHKVGHTLMFQELLRGWKPVWGNADLQQWIPKLEASDLPYSEAVRLLLNRGMGLAFAGEYLKNGTDDPDFIVRNMNKTILGGGDSLLIASGKYCWKGSERVDAYADCVRNSGLDPEYAVMYEKAFRWKLEPEPVLPSDPAEAWEKCRRFYLDSVSLCAGVSAGTFVGAVIGGLHRRSRSERSLKNGLRWLRRVRIPRFPSAWFEPPVVTVLGSLYELLSEKSGYAELPPRLRRLWQFFN